MLKLITALLVLFSFLSEAHPQDGATKTAGKVSIGSVINMGLNGAMAAMMAQQCKPNNPIPCVLAAQSLMQMGSSLKSGKSGTTAAKALLGTDYPTTTFNDDYGNTALGADLDRQLEQGENLYKKTADTIAKNAKIDLKNGTVDTPKGKKSLSSLNSGAAMATAGLINDSQIAEVDDMLDKIDAKLQSGLKIPSMTASAGGGGGGSNGRPTSSIDELKFPSFGDGEGKEKAAAPSAAGLVKMANGEPIGTAGDNIFNMLHSRYQQKVKERMFVGQDGAIPAANNKN